MVTSEYIDVDEKGKMMNCSPVSYKIPNVRSIPRKFNVTLVQEDSITTPVYSAKVSSLYYHPVQTWILCINDWQLAWGNCFRG